MLVTWANNLLLGYHVVIKAVLQFILVVAANLSLLLRYFVSPVIFL
jgi:hypothetical protein